MKISSERDYCKYGYRITIEYGVDEWLFGDLSEEVENIFWAITTPSSDGDNIEAIFSSPALAGEFAVQLRKKEPFIELSIIPMVVDPKTEKESQWWRAIGVKA